MSISKSEFITRVAQGAGQTKAAVELVLSAMRDLCVAEMKAGSVVSVPGLVKLKVVEKKATSERQGINPFTKATITIAAKPASKKVKVMAAKALKDQISS
jgi:nucleoid DNA-binding protein